MKGDLLSLLELAGLWGREYNSIKSMSRRGKFTKMVYLRGDEVARLGLQRSIKAVRNPKGRPYVSIDDPAIPDHVRKKYYAKITTGGPSSSPSLSLPGAGLPSAGGPTLLHFPPPSEDPRPGKDIESTPAVGKGPNLHPSSSKI